MNKQVSEEQWAEIQNKLTEPFLPEETEFRVLSTRGGKSQVAAYIDKIAAMRRLDEVVGVEGWSYDFQPVVIDLVMTKVSEYDETTGKSKQVGRELKEMTRAKGTLTIHGISKSALGDSSATMPSKGCDSDTFKRTCVMWGMGRYLYSLKGMEVDARDTDWGRIKPEVLKRLRQKLPLQTVEEAPEPEYQKATRNIANDAVLSDAVLSNAAPVQIDDGSSQSKQEKTAAIERFATAVSESELPIGKEWRKPTQYAMAKYLQIPLGQANFKQMTTELINLAAKGIEDGKLFWPEEEVAAEGDNSGEDEE